MNKILLTTTLIAATTVSTNAWSFGGVGIFGHKSSHKGGVNAIGVHIDANNSQQSNIDIRSCDSETEELVGTECLPKCPDGLERNTDNSCTICKNKNVYLSYMDDPCGTETPMTCETGSDCWNGLGTDSCCDMNNHLCKNGESVYDEHTDTESYVCDAEAKACKSNVDCTAGEFCNLRSSGDYMKPDSGSCEPLGGGKELSYKGLQFLLSEQDRLHWWGAENWCKAQGKGLARLADFGFIGFGEDLYMYICGEGECEGVSWNDIFESFGGAFTFWVGDSYALGFGCAIRENITIDCESDGVGRKPDGGGFSALCR